ncbi:MmgE/PrpD family protein [Shimia sp. CNT1-13L.2]|uniref:MmgE/PrpD family protein n=1 Tax=Shimia sp. CNT1-13L.2 TaxID=2959663 RepID=UPI0020CE5E7F|nr:MmgE/PrpD family protein [Shimia sp. CNT1-13L.2]MCP9482078.1 MmgE/PrpD family protein [Shimia sp. CNT1-13L.2]
MITQSLADFIANPPEAPHATRHMMALSLLDWVACGMAGAGEPVSRITRDMVSEEGGAAQAHMFGASGKVPARAAALVNGATSHALDYDDTHFAHIGHPSVAVLPAALALAEKLGASGEDFLRSALIGVETSVRVGVWLGRDHYQTGFHQTGTAGAFGAAAAAAHLLGFDAAKVAATLGLTATRASGLKSQFGTMGKPYNAGLAAESGVEAALLVAKGFEPNPMALEAAQGFGPTHAGQALEGALDGLGEDWLFDSISHKFHACCHGLHATLEALAGMNRPAPEDVERVAITTHPRWMTVCNQPDPTTGLGAKFSYRMVVAMSLTGHSTAALDSYSDTLCADPALVALRQRVEVTPDEDVSETEARLRLTLKDGTVLTAAHDLNAPMAMSDREARLKGKAAALIGPETAQALWGIIEVGANPKEIGSFIAG